MTAKMIVATVAWLMLCIGIRHRYNRSRHVPLMLGGIALDYALVIYLELTKDAIATAASFTLTGLQQTHVAVSLTAMLLYLPVMFLGVMLYRGVGGIGVRRWHKRLGIAAFVFRTLGFFFMFSMLSRPE